MYLYVLQKICIYVHYKNCNKVNFTGEQGFLNRSEMGLKPIEVYIYISCITVYLPIWSPRKTFPCLTKPNGREEALLQVICRRIALYWYYLKENRSETNALSLKVKLRDKQGLENSIVFL